MTGARFIRFAGALVLTPIVPDAREAAAAALIAPGGG